jgi:RHS repeat-associated protein
MQGLDYAYTLQGWLKGINSTGGTAQYDMGGDAYGGSINQYVAKDAIGLTLNYFANDYTGINGTPFPGYSAVLGSSYYRPLYNGNISSMSVYQKRFEDTYFPGGPLIFYSYKYDQLNRLTGQDAFNLGYNGTTNNWDSLHSMGDYLKERIAYDGNGNITRYLRNSISGATAGMDSLTYKYYAGTNRLRFIKDSVTSAWISKQDNLIEDLKSQPDSNYAYDEIGNLVKDNKDSITSIKWNVYGKITEINRIASATKPATKIQYTYDALGNRISQVVTTADDIAYTWYVRDAQGNLLSTYTTHGTDTDLSSLGLNQTELYLYGSSRLGVYTLSEGVGGGPDGMDYFGGTSYGRGYKQYELSNHLGNVLTTISDRKIAVPSDTNSSLIDHYDPLILGAQDYYPFGMLSRVAVPNDDPLYRFGFNGKMNDNDVKGLGNELDYGARIYDPRIGKFLSLDPLQKKYPWYTPYQFAGNSPIKFIDLDGAEPFNPDKYVNSDAPSIDAKYKTVNLYRPQGGLVGAAKVAKGMFNAACKAFGAVVEPTAAMEYGSRVKDKAQAFPLTHDNIKYTTANVLAGPALLAKEIKKDPGNEELWGEAALFAFPLAKSYMLRVKVSVPDPMTVEMSKPLSGALASAKGSVGITSRLVTNSEVADFITTEPGAQGPEALSDIQNKINTNDWRVWARPIYTTVYEGETYILDGHNRLKVVSNSEKPVNVTVQQLSTEEATKMFPDKMKDIKAGHFDKKIKDDK